MLLIYYGETEVMKLHSIFDNGMCSHEYVHIASDHSFEDFLALFASFPYNQVRKKNGGSDP